MRPEFGCAVHDYVFAPADATTAGADRRRRAHRPAVLGAADRRRPASPSRSTRADEGVLLIDIGYAIRGSNDPRNLVFPFYVIPDRSEGPP